jgi:hypothetical protein
MSQAENHNKLSRLSRRAALAGLAGTMAVPAAAGTLGASRPDASPDPIFAAIAEHRKAIAAYEVQFEVDEDNTKPALNDQWAAMWEMLETEPTTLLGIVALLDHLSERVYSDDPDWSVFSYALEGLDPEGDARWEALRLPATIAATLRRLIAAQGIGAELAVSS